MFWPEYDKNSKMFWPENDKNSKMFGLLEAGEVDLVDADI